MKRKKLGFIGLGSMGRPMAANIVKAGYPVTVFDVCEEPLVALREMGAEIAGSAREVGQKSDTVVVMVPGYSQMKEAVLPPDGVLGGMSRDATLIITSTLSPAEIMVVEKAARQLGVNLIDSPVSGGYIRAAEATLTLMAGGDDEVVSRHRAILEVMGNHVFHVGKVGQGQSVKLINQMLVSANVVSVAEALVMANKLGLDLASVVDVVSKSGGDSFVLKSMAPAMIARDFKPRAAVSIFTKDTGIIMETARELNVPLLVAGTVYNICRMADALGFGREDVSSVIKVFEALSGIKENEGK